MANSKVTVLCGPRDEVEQEPIIFKGHTRVAKLLVMDRLTKYAYFIATKNTDTAEDTAKRLFACVFSIHGGPSVIVSCRLVVLIRLVRRRCRDSISLLCAANNSTASGSFNTF